METSTEHVLANLQSKAERYEKYRKGFVEYLKDQDYGEVIDLGTGCGILQISVVDSNGRGQITFYSGIDDAYNDVTKEPYSTLAVDFYVLHLTHQTREELIKKLLIKDEMFASSLKFNKDGTKHHSSKK